MINVEKSQPEPDCLAKEKKKTSGSYLCGEVLPRLQTDFYNKCYLCEQVAPTSINVEHFIAHKGDVNLKFDWNNLFYACRHCNGTKHASSGPFLDVTNSTHLVDSWIRYDINPFPKEKPKLKAINGSTETIETVKLLNKIYNGDHTKTKELESANLRQALIEEICDFQKILIEYYDTTNTPDYIKEQKRKIIKHLHPGSAFTAFKRWIIRNNETLMQEFGEEFM